MKLTDESVARKLGWKRTKKDGGGWLNPRNVGDPKKAWVFGAVPAYTTSLDAIVAEVEARRLRWSVHNSIGPFYAMVQPWASGNAKHYEESTAPLALCAALLAYLKEGKP